MSTVLDDSVAISPARALFAVLRRDLFVTGRDLPTFLAQVILQPLLLLFVFGRILTELGFAKAGYAHVLFPGVVAMTVVLTSLQSTAFALVFEFSFTKEIEDRLMAPLPVTFVAVEKMLFAAMRAATAGLVMFPIGILVLGSIPFRVTGLATAAAALVLGSIIGSTLGMTLGTLVPPQRINIAFAL
jgi:ABC-2 type transport system permease protein